MRKILFLAILLFAFGISSLRGQSQCTINHFDELSGMDKWLVTQIVQDRQGMIWVATWNGLNRYDGYQFETFKSQAGDGVVMPSDRIQDIMLDNDGNLLCKIDKRALLFNTGTCKFTTLSEKTEKEALGVFEERVRKARGGKRVYIDIDDPYGQQWRIRRDGELLRKDQANGQYIHYSSDIKPLTYLSYGITDRQGNVWLKSGNGLFRLTFSQRHYQEIRQEKPTRVRSFCLDGKQRYWVTTNDDATIRIYDKNNNLLGYLDRKGDIRSDYVSFGSSIYHIMQDSQGTIWMCSKPDGLFRLREVGNCHFTIEQFRHDAANRTSLGGNELYCTAEDQRGRLWVATFNNGLECVENPREQTLSFANRTNGLHQPDNGSPLRIHHIYITKKGVLLGATTEGLLVGDVTAHDLRSVKFRLHQRDANRSASLSCNAVVYVMEDSKGRIFACTESGGVNQILTDDLLSEQLDFRHFNTLTGLASDIAMSVVEDEESLLVVSNNMLIRLNPDSNVSVGFDIHFWQQPFRFTDAVPLRLPDGKWIFGHHNGAFTISLSDLQKSSFVPPIAFTSLSVQNDNPNKAVNSLDTLTLLPPNRSMTLFFSALDYSDGGDILYAFQMGKDKEWINLGKNRSVSFLNLDPGTYRLNIRSTNSDGVWVDNTRVLTIIVKPTFWETPWATLLYLLLFCAIVYGIYRTRRHIINLRRQQHELQEAYLALLSSQDKAEERIADSQPPVAVPKLKHEDEDFMQRAIKFIEEHISDSDINIGDMADATATSRSGLHRKMKSLLGVTPLDFIREARIRKACKMLKAGDSINDVAYACGFSNPKYFRKCFKDKTGMSPTEYKEQ
ncbi:MAG: AraC family transcriptional regulator [Prevotella sp.]